MHVFKQAHSQLTVSLDRRWGEVLFAQKHQGQTQEAGIVMYSKYCRGGVHQTMGGLKSQQLAGKKEL